MLHQNLQRRWHGGLSRKESRAPRRADAYINLHSFNFESGARQLQLLYKSTELIIVTSRQRFRTVGRLLWKARRNGLVQMVNVRSLLVSIVAKNY